MFKTASAKTILTLAVLTLATTGCSTMTRPKHTGIQEQLDRAAQQQLITPIVLNSAHQKTAPGSLWQLGSKHFFKDSRANQVGDILTILVSETADAKTEAITEVERTHDQDSGATNALKSGLGFITNPAVAAATNIVDTTSNRTFSGDGSTERKDNLSATIAAVVTQVLPNGYLVIQGKREVVINYELQELSIQGIVRPEDIAADNTIASTKIAEARVFYAGRGIVDEAQTPQYGVRFLDKVLPF